MRDLIEALRIAYVMRTSHPEATTRAFMRLQAMQAGPDMRLRRHATRAINFLEAL